MVKQEILPARLAKCNIPAYSAYMAGMMTKGNWRNKPTLHHHKLSITRPDQVTSIDMIVSPIPGLIAQMTSLLTKQ